MQSVGYSGRPVPWGLCDLCSPFDRGSGSRYSAAGANGVAVSPPPAAVGIVTALLAAVLSGSPAAGVNEGVVSPPPAVVLGFVSALLAAGVVGPFAAGWSEKPQVAVSPPPAAVGWGPLMMGGWLRCGTSVDGLVLAPPFGG